MRGTRRGFASLHDARFGLGAHVRPRIGFVYEPSPFIDAPLADREDPEPISGQLMYICPDVPRTLDFYLDSVYQGRPSLATKVFTAYTRMLADAQVHDHPWGYWTWPAALAVGVGTVPQDFKLVIVTGNPSQCTREYLLYNSSSGSCAHYDEETFTVVAASRQLYQLQQYQLEGRRRVYALALRHFPDGKDSSLFNLVSRDGNDSLWDGQALVLIPEGTSPHSLVALGGQAWGQARRSVKVYAFGNVQSNGDQNRFVAPTVLPDLPATFSRDVCAVSFQGELYAFSEQHTAKLEMNVSGSTWQVLQPRSSATRCTKAVVADNEILVFGVSQDYKRIDVWAFDVALGAWTEIRNSFAIAFDTGLWRKFDVGVTQDGRVLCAIWTKTYSTNTPYPGSHFGITHDFGVTDVYHVYASGHTSLLRSEADTRPLLAVYTLC